MGDLKKITKFVKGSTIPEIIDHIYYLEAERDDLKLVADTRLNRIKELQDIWQKLQTLKEAVEELMEINKNELEALNNIGANPPDKLLQKIFSDLQSRKFKQWDKLKELIKL